MLRYFCTLYFFIPTYINVGSAYWELMFTQKCQNIGVLKLILRGWHCVSAYGDEYLTDVFRGAILRFILANIL